MKDSSELIADLKAERAEISDRSWNLAKFLDSHAIEISGDQQSAKDFDRALQFIGDWEPNTATKMMMQQAELPLGV